MTRRRVAAGALAGSSAVGESAAGETPVASSEVPWCGDCSRFWNPSSMGEDGTCPSCGRVLAVAGARHAAVAEAEVERPFTPPPGEEVSTKVPWHFWVLVAAVVAYLTWRIIQMISWVVT